MSNLKPNTSLFRRKPIVPSEGNLKRVLGPIDLTTLGVGAIIGTGIFVLTGVAAAKYAGPGLVLSFLLAGLVCAFAALCYSEFASSVPASGSAYTYSYTTFGEIIAWILGWDLILEYGFASAAVASGWSGYFQSLIAGFGIHLPTALTSAFNPAKGTYFDITASAITLLIALLLTRGVKEATRANGVMVAIKLIVVLVFIAVGVFYVQPSNWTPFLPFGWGGVTAGAATVFFAYIGFDAVSTAAEEVKRPQRDLPIGIIASLAICTVLYIVVSLILTGIVPYNMLNVSDPVAFALQYIQMNGLAALISLGAITGITTVLLVMMYGQSRLLYSMSRDGLLSPVFSKISGKSQTPATGTWVASIVIAFFAGFIPLGSLAELTNIGTLFAFTVVSIGVIVLRRTQPDLKRGFRVPFVPVLPILSALGCVYLMLQLQALTWITFFIWLAIGLVVYFAYGRRHSLLNRG
ncbi:amino acid permease [Paenibacillus hunanensis]|uniref:APA family basic amino acid/polyamine antiporter n=1 Tax=Paenibacillus hunanensis TaxID=539262 RepID=A0ABU1ITD2_9BACL|nr:amino acid permease [Paenibacillus hunanensis]MDR6242161.1 APA family basic amino acid/polyamine antiporter [Paenibacillus hunanensis]WPP39295.1 amino acid permease [Paenibacillus hunanensis]GGJ05713.1 amino acid permease [Paenibacillus hunanensis]